jgi:Ca2+-binding RTX toxin-like protein
VTVNGDAGNDTINGSPDNDILNGGNDLDTLNGAGGNDRISGNDANDTMNGDAGNDTLTGDAGNDIMNGGAGDDVLIGGAGKDNLTGGIGKDFFRFDAALSATTNVDTITDFTVVDDTIRLDDAVFLGLPTGTLEAAAFRANDTGNAAAATDRIIYETDTGKLFFDANGNAAGAKIHFATLTAGLSLTAADFVIV